MIILTDTQAAQVRGVSPSDAYAALEPVPLKDGTWTLGEQVLDDPAHADVKTFMAALPRKEVLDAARYSEAESAVLQILMTGKHYTDAGYRGGRQ